MLSGETWKYEAGGEESGRQKLRVDWESSRLSKTFWMYQPLFSSKKL